MDLDTFINLLILLVFFAVSTILQRRKAAGKKKKTDAGKTGTARPKRIRIPIFDKLGEQLRQYAQELERQARQQKEPMDRTVWEELAEEVPPGDKAVDGEDPFAAGPPPPFEPPAIPPEMKRERPGKRHRAASPPPATCTGRGRRRRHGPAAPIPLRQAVIWAEIVGKPKALQEE